MATYPTKINEKFLSPKNGGTPADSNATGKSASFQCGCAVVFSLKIDTESKTAISAGFQTNGCGYMIAAADFFAESIKGCELAELHGLDHNEQTIRASQEFGQVPPSRTQCVDICIDALRAAFADYRARRIEEFRGEEALICTCFGVSEETIEAHITQAAIETVDEVTRICNAGGGCGSCLMLIQEMIDTRFDNV